MPTKYLIPKRQLFNNHSDVVVLINKRIHSNTNSTSIGSIQPRCIVRDDSSFTFPLLSVSRYSFTQQSKLGCRGENENAKIFETAAKGNRTKLSRGIMQHYADRIMQIRQRLVVGIPNEHLSKDMQMMDEKTLTDQKAVSAIRQKDVSTNSHRNLDRLREEKMCIVSWTMHTRIKVKPKSRGSRQQHLPDYIRVADAATCHTLYNSAQRIDNRTIEVVLRTP